MMDEFKALEERINNLFSFDYTADDSGRILSVSYNMENLLGHSTDSFLQIFRTKTTHEYKERINDALQTGRSYVYETTYLDINNYPVNFRIIERPSIVNNELIIRGKAIKI